ncbi:MAG: hypothetical protein K5829_01650 [Treponema sp.]|nr:hypothetical protein [Treponema sp.]
MKKISPARIMYFCASIVLFIATAMNLLTHYKFISIIPYTKYVEAVVNFSSAVLCIILTFKPELKRPQYILFFVQSTITTLIGFAGIGTMLLCFLGLLLFVNGFFKSKVKIKLIFFGIWWLLVILGVYIGFGPRPAAFVTALTLLYIAMLATIYEKLSQKLSYLLPQKVVSTKSDQLPSYGSKLSLSDYGLTERQKKFLLSAMNGNQTYEKIANENYVSLSIVKLEMSQICKIFGVKNKEELKILLLQYKIEP